MSFCNEEEVYLVELYKDIRGGKGCIVKINSQVESYYTEESIKDTSSGIQEWITEHQLDYKYSRRWDEKLQTYVFEWTDFYDSRPRHSLESLVKTLQLNSKSDSFKK